MKETETETYCEDNEPKTFPGVPGQEEAQVAAVDRGKVESIGPKEEGGAVAES